MPKKGESFMEIFESFALILIMGVICAAWLVSTIIDKIFGIGFYPILSTIIGSVVGIVILLIWPLAGVAAMIAAGVVALITSIVQEKTMRADLSKPDDKDKQ